MPEVYPSPAPVNPAPAPIRHLFPVESPPKAAIRDEEAPPYDGRRPKRGRHMTVIEDDVVMAVCAECGMAAAGLYLLLERRVGADGRWTCTVGDLARSFRQSERHVYAAAAALQAAGFLERKQAHGPRGAVVGVVWFLPKHMRTYAPEPTPEVPPEVTPEVTPEPSRAHVKEISNNGVVGSSSSGTTTTKPGRTKTALPDDFAVTPEMRTWAVEKARVPEDDVDIQTEQFLDHYRHNGEKGLDWPAKWRTWMRNAVAWGRVGTRARAAPNGVHRGKDIGLSNAEVDDFLAKAGLSGLVERER
jgi:hypothetical protein